MNSYHLNFKKNPHCHRQIKLPAKFSSAKYGNYERSWTEIKGFHLGEHTMEGWGFACVKRILQIGSAEVCPSPSLVRDMRGRFHRGRGCNFPREIKEIFTGRYNIFSAGWPRTIKSLLARRVLGTRAYFRRTIKDIARLPHFRKTDDSSFFRGNFYSFVIAVSFFFLKNWKLIGR